MLLAFDTATTTASIALYDRANQQLVAEYTWEARRRQTQDLLVTAQQLLQQSALSTDAISALAVTTGPGSFTGVRIGISTVKGIGLGLPARPAVIGIPTLAVTAAPWLDLLQRTQSAGLLCPFIHAGRKRYNWCFFEPDALLWCPTATDHQGGPLADLVAALATKAPQPIWVAGEDDAALVEAMASLPHVVLIDAVSSWRRAGQLARLANRHLTVGHSDDLATLQPLYLRNP